MQSSDQRAPDSVRPVAVITGASGGIGQAFAERLARDGYDLILTARRLPLLETLARQIGTETGAAAEVLVADLTRDADRRRLEERVAGESRLEMLVNNAGAGLGMPAPSPGAAPGGFLERVDEMTQFNILAPTRLARVAAERMVARGRGAIINLSSTSVFFPVMSQASPYVPAKAYILWFSQRLSRELRGTGVAVQALCPHYTRTDWFENAQSNVSRVPEGDWMDAATVVQASLRSLALGETVCVPPLEDASLLADLRAAMDRIRDSLHGHLASRYADDDRTAQA